jgi:D-inositol-3-phosphate glycosyltransferase
MPDPGLRIALVALHTSPLAQPGTGDAGGMNVVVAALGDGLAARGHDVELLTRRSSPDLPDSVRTPGGARLRFLDAGPAAAVRKEELPALTGAFGAALAALPAFDVVHAHYWLSALAAFPAAGRAARILSLHTVAALKNASLAPGDAPEPEARLAAERRLLREADVVLAGSAAEGHAIAEQLDPQRDSLRIVPPGVDTALFRPADGGGLPAALDRLPPVVRARAAASGYLVAAGRVQPLKGQELAVRMLAALPSDVRPALLLVGEATPGADGYLARVLDTAASLGVADAVTAVGALDRPDLAAVLRHARLVLVPSHSETFGLVALEAAASGVPVVASAAGGLVESVAGGGILVAGRDPREWAAVVAGLLADPARRAALGAAGRAHAAEHAWPRVAALTEAAYRSALSASSPR